MTDPTPPPIDWKVESQRFDGVADYYDRYRPSYPPEMIEDILRISGLQPDGRILEIGSGTGKATLLFARRGYRMLCLEPGQNLIETAAINLAACPQVRFVRARFEEWEADQAYDLVISAQAYHWVPEAVRYERTAAALKPGGYLAAFWNLYPGMQEDIRRDLDEVYRQYAPEIAGPGVPIEQVIASRADSLRASPYFDRIELRQYPWSARYETKFYLGLLNTYSDHLRLPEESRRLLFDKIAAVIDRHGGYIDRPYLGVVYLARRVG